MGIFSRPPCPDPGKYIWVESREGGHWRRMRGSVKPAKLNTVYIRSNENMKISSPAAKRIMGKLHPHLHGLTTGRLTAKISGKLRMALNKKGKVDFSFFKELDLQPDHTFGRLLLVSPQVILQKNNLTVKIPVGDSPVKQHSKLVTDYYFELVLLYGDPTKPDGLRIESEISDVYPVKGAGKKNCQLQLVTSKTPWMALLKVNCIEGNEPAIASRNYAMKVICVNDD